MNHQGWMLGLGLALAYGPAGAAAGSAASPATPLRVQVPGGMESPAKALPAKTTPAKPVAVPVKAPAGPPAPDPLAEALVPSGRYYVGRASGSLDYKRLANASTTAFLVLRSQVGQALFSQVAAWATLHGYTFDEPCGPCAEQGDAAVSGLSWRNAALFANALSEQHGLDAVYRDRDGKPVRSGTPPGLLDRVVIEPSLSGYRLPTIPEWQIAMRGADKALADGTYGERPRDGVNALGLGQTTGPQAEWTASAADLDEGQPAVYACNQPVAGTPELSACEALSTRTARPDIAFRLIRTAPPQPKLAATPPRPTPPQTVKAGAPATVAGKTVAGKVVTGKVAQPPRPSAKAAAPTGD